MPLKKCSEGGKSGWKWGNQGHCYTGPGAKKKAIKQGIAVEGPDKFAQIASAENDEPISSDELVDAMVEVGYGPVEIALAVAQIGR